VALESGQRLGRELFYWDDATSSMMAVSITFDPNFRASAPTRLFSGDYRFNQAGRHYDVSADGKRFLMVKPVVDDDETGPGQGHKSSASRTGSGSSNDTPPRRGDESSS
jgi:hypothetical protein